MQELLSQWLTSSETGATKDAQTIPGTLDASFDLDLPSLDVVTKMHECGFFENPVSWNPVSNSDCDLHGNNAGTGDGGDPRPLQARTSPTNGALNDTTSSTTAPTSELNNPVEYLCASDKLDVDGDYSGGLRPGEQLRDVFTCQIVTPFSIKAGEFLVGQQAFYFKEDSTKLIRGQSRIQPPAVVALGTIVADPGQLPCWLSASVQEVHDRRYLLQQTALEIYLTDGTTIFMVFADKQTRDSVQKLLLSLDLPNFVDYNSTVKGSLVRDSISNQWAKGIISNFEYLMHVNKLAGRTFNDLTQYVCTSLLCCVTQNSRTHALSYPHSEPTAPIFISILTPLGTPF